MFHMLSSFDLKEGESLIEFQCDLTEFIKLLKQHDLIIECGPVGKRDQNTILDTDDRNSREYFMLMHFADKTQSERAVAFIYQTDPKKTYIHPQMYERATNMVFTCWEDIS